MRFQIVIAALAALAVAAPTARPEADPQLRTSNPMTIKGVCKDC
jgi:hypothetical protein